MSGLQIALTGVLIIAVLGLNFVAWGLVGLARLVDERIGPHFRGASNSASTNSRVGVGELAVLMAAHNEEAVIVDSLRSLPRVMPLSHVYVANDGSTDNTGRLTREFGVQVLDLFPNRGKAGALCMAIEHFALLDRYKAVLFLDADTRLDSGYLDAALHWFDDPGIVAVAGYATPIWAPHHHSWMGRMLAAYRHRLYAITQILQKYGQTWRFANVTYIVPGFASIYRTDTLRQIDIDPPGLVIEDFNMTFEIHHRRLGRIAFSPAAIARCHEPTTYQDYVRQVGRWVLGFWQTIRRHGIWRGRFWAALGLWIIELVIASVGFLVLPFVVLILGLPVLWDAPLDWPGFAAVHDVLSSWTTLAVIGLMLLPDLVITATLGIRKRRPIYVLLAFGFPLLRVTDAFIALTTIRKAWTETSTGAWRSPKRV